jgi:2-haloacid dehalogenase
VTIVDAIDDYRPFDGSIEAVLGTNGIETTAAERAQTMAVYDDLDPFAGVRDGLAELARTHRVYVLSMGRPAMLDSLLEHADIGDGVEDAISVDESRRYKPHAAVYRHGAARTGTPIENVAHVAGPSFDVRGAMAVGMQGVWIDRTGEPWDPCFPDPDLRIDSFHDLVEVLE